MIKKILKTPDPSHSLLNVIIFLLLNISYAILHHGYFRNLKTNQLLSKELYYTHFPLYVTLLMSNTLNEQLAVVSLDSFSQDGLRFHFFCPSYVWLRNKFIHILEVVYTNIQSKIKLMVSLSNLFTIKMGGVHQGCPLSMLLYISAAIKYFQFSLMLTGGLDRRYEMKILFFPDDTTIFLLRDINWNTRIQLVLKLHEKGSGSKRNFSKIQALWAGVY